MLDFRQTMGSPRFQRAKVTPSDEKLPFLKNYKHSRNDHSKPDHIVPTDWFPQIQHRKYGKHGEGDGLLNRLQLRSGECVRANSIGGNLKTILGEGNSPTDQNDLEQGRLAIFQMAVPGKRHENIRNCE